MIAADALQSRDQRASAGGHADADLLGDDESPTCRPAPDWADAAASRAPWRAPRLRPATGSSRPEPGTARRPRRPPPRSTTTELGDEHSTPLSKLLPSEDVPGGLDQVGGRLDVARRVAGADAVRGLAGAVRRAHQAHAPGGQNHRDLALLHQLLRAFERHRRHPADGALGSAGGARGLGHDLGDAGDAARGRRMRADDDGAARLDARSGSCRSPSRSGLVDGTMAATTPNGSAISTTRRSSWRLTTPTVFIGRMKACTRSRREEVLLDLVGDDAEAGFLDGQPAPAPRRAAARRRPSRRRSRRSASGKVRR